MLNCANFVGGYLMSRYTNRKALKELIQKNIRDLKNDPKLLEEIEKRIEINFMKTTSKAEAIEK